MTKRTCPHCQKRVPVQWEGKSTAADSAPVAIFAEHDPCPGSYAPVDVPHQHKCIGLAQPVYDDSRGRCGPVDMSVLIGHLSSGPMTSKDMAKTMGMSERRAQTALLQAFRDGIATRERTRRGSPYVYSIA